MKKLITGLIATLAVLLLILVGLTIHSRSKPVAYLAETIPPTEPIAETTEPLVITEPVTEPTEAPTEPATEPVFAPYCVADTDPANWEIEWEIVVGEEEVTSFQRQEPLNNARNAPLVRVLGLLGRF